MPELSRCPGIIITLYYDDHGPPRFVVSGATNWPRPGRRRVAGPLRRRHRSLGLWDVAVRAIWRKYGAAAMIDDIAAHREEVAALCRRFHVRRLDLFGSAARGADFDRGRSDLDFLVEFDRATPRRFDAYFGLKEGLEELFGHPVDLVELSAVYNPYLKASIEKNRRNVFAA
jgi:hypothetical protein